MKIAQIICVFPPYRSGMGNSAYNFSRVLAEQGHEVTVFTIDYGQNQGDLNKEIDDNFKLVKLRPLVKYGNAGLLPQLFWHLNNFDIVHLHYPFYGAAEFILLKKILTGKKMKLIMHYHMDSAALGVKGFIFKIYRVILLPLLARACEMITCASLDYIKHSNLADYYHKYKTKFRQILFGVDMEKFIIYNVNKDRYRLSKEKEKIILFVANLDRAHYFKGVENLLKASKIIIKNLSKPDKINAEPELFYKIKLTIIGDGELKPYYKNLARELGIGKNVFFAGNIDDSQLAEYYNGCDLVVLPSINRGEAFGLVLLEAMACAKPVVASNLPGVRSVFKNGREGLLVKPNNVRDLVDKLKIILEDETIAKEMGRAGRKLVEDKYTWDKVGQRLNLIYHYVRYRP